jgi:glycosyltransferase involved in cell wall biosynthesis
MSLYIDLTELLASLRKTGIERIGGEICRYLPTGTAVPVRFESGRYFALPPALVQAIGGFFRNTVDSGAAEIGRLSAGRGSAIKLSHGDVFLVPEIFGEDRAAFFRAMSEQELQCCWFIVYDLLPFTHPEYFPVDLPLIMNGYFQVIRRGEYCGFISEYTQDAYYRRLKRTETRNGVVLPLGCDSLGPRPERPILNRPLSFSVLGTIEPRKNHELILEAFEPLLGHVDGLSLSFIGRMGWVDSAFANRVHALASDRKSGFRFFSAPSDDEICNHVERSRATIYISAAEGYGLPPVESLWLGTPVIASRMIPSLQRLGSAGIHYVEPLNVISLRRAILAFVDNAYANRKAEEAMRLNLPTWRSFTEEVLRWCAQN